MANPIVQGNSRVCPSSRTVANPRNRNPENEQDSNRQVHTLRGCRPGSSLRLQLCRTNQRKHPIPLWCRPVRVGGCAGYYFKWLIRFAFFSYTTGGILRHRGFDAKPETVQQKARSLQEASKEIVGFHVFLTRLFFGGGILRR
jgi:hypothetical protein